MHDQSLRNSQACEKNEGRKCSRRWTTSQLQRKRQLDRESQRVSREKTRNRISYLEGLVKSFQENDDDRVQKLLQKIDDQASEIQSLRDVIRGITRLIDGSTIASGSTDSIPESHSPRDNHRSVDGQSNPQTIIEETPCEYMNVPCGSMDIQSAVILPMDDSIFLEDITLPSIQDHNSNQEPHTVAQLAASIAEDRCLDGRLWYLAGGVLSYLLQTHDVESSFSIFDDEDIAIRAVFEGWSAVTEIYDLDSGWQWLRELDERIYHHLPVHDRLVHLRNTRLIFINQVCPSTITQKQIPSFFAAQSSKPYSQYDPLAEHFPWPGFRRRLSFSPLKFATDKFMDSLRTNVDFLWNQDAHELYTRSPLDGRYQYSNSLVRRTMDIRCYAAKQEFFHAFPELRADIPCSILSLHSLLPLEVENDAQKDDEMLLHDDG